MLPPDARSVLSDLLRPPPGAVLDRAVALTFTLDLNSALVVPLSFAAHRLRETNDPLAVMEAIRSCTGKVDIFCQSGQMLAPTQPNDLHAFLETMVHQVRRPRPGRLFHPKLWAVRYWDEAEDAYPIRLLVLSRNLTADQSWDVCLRLDGHVTTLRSAANRPLATLLRHSMDLAVDLPEARRRLLDEFVEDVRRTDWEMPDGVEDIAFHALGVPSSPRPNFAGSRHLVIAPFCNAAGMELVASGDRQIVVSRQDELDRLPEDALDRHEVFVLSELAGLVEHPSEEPGGRDRSLLTGLHAKMYVIEQGWKARVLIGSANATDAAFEGNVELLVELQGSRTKLGVDTMLGVDAAFRALLEPYERRPAVQLDEDEWWLQNLLRDLAAVPFVLTVQPERAQRYTAVLTTTAPLPDIREARVVAELLTRRGEAVELRGGVRVDGGFTDLGITDVTPFVRITAHLGQKPSISAVVRARLVGDPAGRLDEILARQVDTPEKFLRFLALLLGLTPDSLDPTGSGTPGGGEWSPSGAPGVLELLMRALVDRPDQLADLARLMTRLRATDRGQDLIPTGFDELWAAVDQVRRELAAEVQA